MNPPPPRERTDAAHPPLLDALHFVWTWRDCGRDGIGYTSEDEGVWLEPLSAAELERDYGPTVALPLLTVPRDAVE